jgi:hypothetical protein
MVEFQTEYYTPMDRGYHDRSTQQIRPQASIEEPIIPIRQLGQTVPEHNQIKGTNILQNVQAAIRGGTGSMQIVFMTPIESAIGGRPKAYGEEIRQAIKETAMANEVMITGMEMPTSLSNLSGWDPQRGVIDEEKRRRDLDEVKDTIRFAAETAQGGGVDIVSFEYERPLHRAEWLDSEAKKAFSRALEVEEGKEDLLFVDKDSGAIARIPIREGIPMPIKKETWEKMSPEEIMQGAQPQMWEYKDFENYAKHALKKKQVTYEEVAQFVKNSFMDEQINLAKGQEGEYMRRLQIAKDEFRNAEEELQSAKEQNAPKPRIDELEAKKTRWKQIYDSDIVGLQEQRRIQQQHEARKNRLEPMEKFVLSKTEESYAEAAIAAMNLQRTHELKGQPLKKDLYVGPEIGWPQFYGSHPQEFVEIIRGARKKMTEMLTNPATAEQFGFDRPLSKPQAEEEARRHIQGTFDTSHMGMWMQNFHPELPWNERLEKFKKWYKEQINWLAEANKKEQVIGAIQAVDSAGPAHGHLPPGQGILPVKDAIEILKTKGGFNGYILSEGHEEERFGEGRILLKTWEHFNAPFSTGYAAGMPGPKRWGEVAHGYFGRTYSPMFLFGAYAPSNEFKLWSDVPLE